MVSSTGLNHLISFYKKVQVHFGQNKIYEIENAYIDYLVPFAPHLFHNKKENQENERKYIGIILTVNGLDYFSPLSSFKEKHKKMKNNMDFLKVGNYAVINLNNMFPVPKSQCLYVDISKESNPSYKALLSAEYRIIASMSDKILNTKNSSGSVSRGHNNELNRTGLEPVSALNFLLG